MTYAQTKVLYDSGTVSAGWPRIWIERLGYYLHVLSPLVLSSS